MANKPSGSPKGLPLHQFDIDRPSNIEEMLDFVGERVHQTLEERIMNYPRNINEPTHYRHILRIWQEPGYYLDILVDVDFLTIAKAIPEIGVERGDFSIMLRAEWNDTPDRKQHTVTTNSCNSELLLHTILQSMYVQLVGCGTEVLLEKV